MFAVVLAMYTVLQYPHLGLRLELGRIYSRKELLQRCGNDNHIRELLELSLEDPFKFEDMTMPKTSCTKTRKLKENKVVRKKLHPRTQVEDANTVECEDMIDAVMDEEMAAIPRSDSKATMLPGTLDKKHRHPKIPRKFQADSVLHVAL